MCSIKAVIIVIFCVLVVKAAKYTGPTNQAGLNLIKEFEGFRANFYQDSVGIRTIGYGHACHVSNCNVPLSGRYAVPLTTTNGERLLQEDLQEFETCVRNAITFSSLNANQFSALVSFSFNLGCGSLRRSSLRTLLNQGDVGGASREFGKWVRAGGKRLPGLVRRRGAERTLFCSGGLC
ncbi:lysozyme RrrD [Folsomia candida]|uniref:lysozyme RrrD n=1 Tax=Folsomia candida TaxID=158441 RepID=UPI000B8F9B30|nr:lysozyme RrrD [Folsomia candida]